MFKKSRYIMFVLSQICSLGLLINIAFSGEVDTSKAVIHHTASPDWSVERIRKIHMEERGWSDVGYHFVIRKDGSIEHGRSLDKKGAHAKGRNGRVGIVLTGYDSFAVAQTESLTRLLRSLGVKEIERHHELCPGKGLNLEDIL